MTYVSDGQEELALGPVVTESPYREGGTTIPEGAWYADSSSHGQPPRAIAFHPKTEMIWMEVGEGKSSQWAELQVVWLVITPEALPSGCLHQ